MTNAEIVKKFRATIDQYYAFPWNLDKDYREQHQQIYIGGILQAALHILPWDDYYGLKTYIWEKHGYDPGGVTDGQMTIEELMESN